MDLIDAFNTNKDLQYLIDRYEANRKNVTIYSKPLFVGKKLSVSDLPALEAGKAIESSNSIEENIKLLTQVVYINVLAQTLEDKISQMAHSDAANAPEISISLAKNFWIGSVFFGQPFTKVKPGASLTVTSLSIPYVCQLRDTHHIGLSGPTVLKGNVIIVISTAEVSYKLELFNPSICVVVGLDTDSMQSSVKVNMSPEVDFLSGDNFKLRRICNMIKAIAIKYLQEIADK